MEISKFFRFQIDSKHSVLRSISIHLLTKRKSILTVEFFSRLMDRDDVMQYQQAPKVKRKRANISNILTEAHSENELSVGLCLIGLLTKRFTSSG